MVKRVFGKVDGIEVNYDHSKGDWWNVPVPLDIDGEYVIEVIAEDEAGNQSFITRLLYTVKGENICVHQLPLSGYLFEKVELSPNPVVVNGKVKISVTIVTHNYLNKNYTHKQLATYTHKQLKDRGTT